MILINTSPYKPIPVAMQLKACVGDLPVAGNASSNPAGGNGYLSLPSDVRCQVEVSAKGRSFVQSSPTDSVVSNFV